MGHFELFALQSAPEFAVLTQPTPVTQLSMVHSLLSTHGSRFPEMQLPFTHWSFSVHGSPSSHPSLCGVLKQPETGLHSS